MFKANWQILLLLFKLFSIFCQIYALSTLRDDFTLLQHHSSKISGLEDETNLSLVRRHDEVQIQNRAILFWSRNGILKLEFNWDVNHYILRMAQYSAEWVVSSIITEMQNRLSQSVVRNDVRSAVWEPKVDMNWARIVQAGVGAVTFGIIIVLPRHDITVINRVVDAVTAYYECTGKRLDIRLVPNAYTAANDVSKPKPKLKPKQKRSSIESSSTCLPPIQFWPLTFVDGELGSLEPTFYKCKGEWEWG